MSAPKLSFEESLEKTVVSTEKCAGCAACVTVCPFNCLQYTNEKPSLIKKCEACGICPKVCPRYEWSLPTVEKFVFGRERNADETFGIHQRLVAAQATDPSILEKCQDGGVVTALLTYALKKGIIEGATVSGFSSDRPFHPISKLATTPQEILSCAGTRYTYSPNLLALQEAIKQKKKNLGFVGTPCQIHAIRKMQTATLKKYVDPIRFMIGLMCTESFTYEGLMQKHIQNILNVNLSDVKKINIKGKILVTTNAGETKTIPLADVKQYTRKGCLHCTDFSSELADISTGGLGLNRWTFTIIRTKQGRELFEQAETEGIVRTKPVEEEKFALDLLVKLSRSKQKRSQ